jgi:hypothetical protein
MGKIGRSMDHVPEPVNAVARALHFRLNQLNAETGEVYDAYLEANRTGTLGNGGGPPTTQASTPTPAATPPRKRKMGAAQRKALSLAAKKRWAMEQAKTEKGKPKTMAAGG